MKIIVLGDTHMPRMAKSLPLALVEGLRTADLILHVGDWQTLAVRQMLETFAPVDGVAGNGDGPELVTQFGRRKILEVAGVRIGLVHGHEGPGASTEERARRAFAATDVDIILFGHSHIPLHRTAGNVLLFNPGSATDKRRQPQYSYGVLTLTAGHIAAHHVFSDNKRPFDSLSL